MYIIHYIDQNGDEYILYKFTEAEAIDELGDFMAVFGGWGYVEKP